MKTSIHLHFPQPASVHGVGTVRHRTAVNVPIVQCRHNVSARDGEIPASRRPGMGAFLCALHPADPRMHSLCRRESRQSLRLLNRAFHPATHRRRPPQSCALANPPIIPRTGCGGRSGFSKWANKILRACGTKMGPRLALSARCVLCCSNPHQLSLFLHFFAVHTLNLQLVTFNQQLIAPY